MRTRLLKKCRKNIRIVLVHGMYQMERRDKGTGIWMYRCAGSRERVLQTFHSCMRNSEAYNKAWQYQQRKKYWKREESIIRVC